MGIDGEPEEYALKRRLESYPKSERVVRARVRNGPGSRQGEGQGPLALAGDATVIRAQGVNPATPLQD